MTADGIVAIVGNPKPASRTSVAAQLVAQRLADLVLGGARCSLLDLAEYGPHLLTWGDTTVAELKTQVLEAKALVVATPTYKASFTGLLKLFLDQFDTGELHGVPTVALMTGGSTIHALAVDVHLVPVLVEIGASCPTRGVFLAGPQVDVPEPTLDAWFETARPALARALSG